MDEKIITESDLGYIPHPGGLGCTLFEKMWENQDKLAQIDGQTGKQEFYWSLLQNCVRAAHALQSMGISRSDVVLIFDAETTDVCVPFVASLFIGAIPAVYTPLTSSNNLISVMKQVDSKIIFCGVDAIDVIQQSVNQIGKCRKIVTFGPTKLHLPFDRFLKSAKNEGDFKPLPTRRLKETAMIIFNSESPPKGVCLNHYGLLKSAYNFGYKLPTKRVLPYVPFSCIASLCTLIATTLYGTCRITPDRSNLKDFWNILDVHQPTVMILDSDFVTTIAKLNRPSTVSQLRLQDVIVVDGVLAERQIYALQAVLPEPSILMAYDRVEMSGLVSFFTPYILKERGWIEKKPTSFGSVLPGYSFKIVNIKTEESLNSNEMGELRIKSDYSMNGYLDEDSSNLWDDDRWFKTGDDAYYDRDACLYLDDFEQSITRHPLIKETAVVRMRYKLNEECSTVIFATLLNNNNNGLKPEEIEQSISPQKKFTLKIVKEIPRGSDGSVDVDELKKRFEVLCCN